MGPAGKRKRFGILHGISCSGSATAIDRARLRLLDAPGDGGGLGWRLQKLGVSAAANIPYVLTAVNLLSLLVLFTLEWLPSGEVPYGWATVLAPLAAGLVSTAYHYLAGSPMVLKASSLAGNAVTLLLLLAAVYFPKRTCCRSVPRGRECGPGRDDEPGADAEERS